MFDQHRSWLAGPVGKPFWEEMDGLCDLGALPTDETRYKMEQMAQQMSSRDRAIERRRLTELAPIRNAYGDLFLKCLNFNDECEIPL